MNEKVKRFEEPPEIAPEPNPTITSEMISDVFRVLEAKGMIHYGEGGIYIPTEKGWRLLMSTEAAEEEVEAFGHPEINAESLDEIKIVKCESVKSNSVIGVRANKSCVEFDKKFKNSLKSSRKLEVVLEADDVFDTVLAYCSPALRLSSNEEISIRKDDRIGASTIGIMSNKTAFELRRDLIEKLKNPDTKLKIKLRIKS